MVIRPVYMDDCVFTVKDFVNGNVQCEVRRSLVDGHIVFILKSVVIIAIADLQFIDTFSSRVGDYDCAFTGNYIRGVLINCFAFILVILIPDQFNNFN